MSHSESITSAERAFETGNISLAHRLCVQRLNQSPGDSEALHLLALLNLSINQLDKARELCKHAIKRQKRDKYIVSLCKIYALQGETSGVSSLSNLLQADRIKTPLQADTMGVALSKSGLHKQALTYFRRAVSFSDDCSYRYNLAVCCKFCGHLDEARSHLIDIIKRKPDHYAAHYSLSEIIHDSAIDWHRSLLEEALSAHSLSTEAIQHCSHALSRLLERQGEFQRAFDALNIAKRALIQEKQYQPSQHRELFQRLKGYAPPEKSTAPIAEAAPIFIVGLPRSGTTLVERIMGSHSSVTAGGELEAMIDSVRQLSGINRHGAIDAKDLEAANEVNPNALAKAYIRRVEHLGSTEYFTDKLPFNFYLLPAIRNAFPQAKIICLLRDPLDLCASNYRQLFNIYNQNYQYTQTMPHIFDIYWSFLEWIQHWQRIDSTGNFYIQRYESLVTRPRENIQRLLEFCNLPWEESCVAISQNTASVSTASNLQVRDAIHTNYIGHWKPYEPFIGSTSIVKDLDRLIADITSSPH